MECTFCPPLIKSDDIVLENTHCLFLQKPEPILIGSGIILPRAHRATVFDLSPGEWTNTFLLLQDVKKYLDQKFSPQGYNLGWNSGGVAGQEVFHCHLHVIPRYADEPLAGKGIRYWLKQDINKRG